MGYRHISNLYKNKDILYFKRCYAMEKIHGTSAHVQYSAKADALRFFSGGAKHEHFLALFDHDELLEKFRENARNHANVDKITIYGECYGGKMQAMRETYGPDLKFIAFEVLLDSDCWMSVPQADRMATRFGFEFVHYVEIETTEEAINAEMMADSVQAVRNGMGPGHMREGVVLRPLIEFTHLNGGRVICKHKRPEFAERRNTPRFVDPEQLKILEDAKEIAEEWVNSMRLKHVLDAFPDPKIEDSNKIIKAMREDVIREAAGEIIISKAVNKAIGKKTMKLFKHYLASKAIGEQ